MSDTPRTDAAMFVVVSEWPERQTSVPADLGRTLERELSAVTRERDDAYANVEDADRELKALRAEVERLRAALSLYRFDKDMTGQYGAEAALQEPTP